MAIRFECDPELAASSSTTLAEIRDQIDPVGQWLGDTGLVGVQQLSDSLCEFADAASGLTADLTARVGGASDLLGQLASGTHEVDESLLARLGMMTSQQAGQASPEQLALAREYLSLPPKPMNSQYEGEQYPGNDIWPDDNVVKYLDSNERRGYQLTVRDGKLYDADGNLFDTRNAKTLWTKDEGRAIFVVDNDGNIYASTFQERGVFHHSSFLGGESVAGAGELRVVDGKLELISDNSGHYTPTQKYTNQVIRYLNALGVNLDGSLVEYHSKI